MVTVYAKMLLSTAHSLEGEIMSMKRHFLRVIGLTGIVVLFSVTVLEGDVFARAGGNNPWGLSAITQA